MLKMGAVAAINGNRSPSILQNANFRSASVDHRLDSKYHPRLQPGALAGGAEVRNLGIFVHRTPNPVPNKLPNNPKTFRFTEFLDGGGDIAQPSADLALLDRLLEGCLGHFEKLCRLGADLADRVGHGGVGVVSVDNYAAVDRKNVALGENSLGIRHAVNNLVIDRSAQCSRKAVISLEGCDRTQLRDLLDGNLLEIHRRSARDDVGRNRVVDLAKSLTGDPHLLDLLRRFDHDSHSAVRLDVTGLTLCEGG